MWNNQLYAFIVTQLLKEQTTRKTTYPLITQIQQKNSLTYNSGYCVLALNVNGVPNSYGNYWLVDHHISIYERFDPKTPVLSECHYTGYFVDDSGAYYQLHVYFDANGKVLRAPLFQSAQQKEPLTPFVKQQLIQLATQQTQPLLSKLHTDIEQELAKLTQEYEELEKQCNTLTPENLQKLSVHLDKMIALSKEKSLSLYSSRKKLILSLLKEIQKPVDMIPPAAPEPTETNNPTEEKVLITTTNPMPQPPTINIDAIKTASRSYLQESDLAKKAQTLNTLLQNIYTEQLSENMPLKTLQELYTIERLALKVGAQLFTQVINAGQFEIAKTLSCFYNHLSLKNLETALQQKKPVYLKFLLEKGDYNLDTQALVIDGKTYSSAVAYYLHQAGNGKNTEETIENIKLCFAHLLQKGIDLFTLDESGVPIAHIILSDRQHLLHDTLIEFIAPNHTYFLNQLKKLIISLLSASNIATLSESPHTDTEATPAILPLETSQLKKPDFCLNVTALPAALQESLEKALNGYLSPSALTNALNIKLICGSKNNVALLTKAMITENARVDDGTEDTPEIQALLERVHKLMNIHLKSLSTIERLQSKNMTLDLINTRVAIQTPYGEHTNQPLPLAERQAKKIAFLNYEIKRLELECEKDKFFNTHTGNIIHLDPSTKKAKKIYLIDQKIKALTEAYQAQQRSAPAPAPAPAPTPAPAPAPTIVEPHPEPVLSKKKQKEAARLHAQLEKARLVDEKKVAEETGYISEIKKNGLLDILIITLTGIKLKIKKMPAAPEVAGTIVATLYPEGLSEAEKPMLYSWIQKNHPHGLPEFEQRYLAGCKISLPQ